MVWNCLQENNISIIPNWMNIEGSSKWENADWMVVPKRENKGYNKYDMNDGTYVYQKYIIGKDVTIEKVLNQMLQDLNALVQMGKGM